MKSIIAGLLATAILLPTAAEARPGVCWYKADGSSAGRDGCRAGKVLTPCSAGNPNAKCVIGTRGQCKGNGDYKKYVVVDRSGGFNCPKKY